MPQLLSEELLAFRGKVAKEKAKGFHAMKLLWWLLIGLFCVLEMRKLVLVPQVDSPVEGLRC